MGWVPKALAERFPLYTSGINAAKPGKGAYIGGGGGGKYRRQKIVRCTTSKSPPSTTHVFAQTAGTRAWHHTCSSNANSVGSGSGGKIFRSGMPAAAAAQAKHQAPAKNSNDSTNITATATGNTSRHENETTKQKKMYSTAPPRRLYRP